ncbi:MAG: dihydroorotate dehydrogenase (quinone), partial [Nanoarchaeota archaeon]|nr:dihydroorotate dehydrogenase (quinone) [Nanoarchaeota archaeon]
MGIIYKTLRPAIFRFDPEDCHNAVLGMGRLTQKIPGACELLKKVFEYSDPRLECEVDGVRYKNPVGLAAGFDKNGKICEFIESLGFGFMEVGSVTYNGGKGNPRPR